MTQTFTQDVLVDGSQDTTQLRVQGHTTQTDPLQTWEDSAGDPLAQMTDDGRLQIGDIGMTTPDALIEAHRDDALKPKRGIHSLGRISGALSDAVSWMVGELELLGSGGVSGLQTALRARLTHSNSGDSTTAELRAGDFETINDGGSSGDPVGRAAAVRAAVTNTQDAYLDEAVGLDVAIAQEAGGSGEIAMAYGVRVADVEGAADNYAIYTGKGFAHFGDSLEVQRPAAVPGTPATDILRVYPKSDGKLYAKNWSGTEYDLTASGGGGGGTLIGSHWQPDVEPASPSSLDDEFDDASFNTTLWTEFDPSTTISVSETAAGLFIDQADQSGALLGGIYQDLPSGDFTVWTKLSQLSNQAGNATSGLALYDDASGSTSAIHLFMLQRTGIDTYVKAERFSDYATFDTSYAAIGDVVIASTVYLRIRRDGSDYHFDWSSDGLGWTHLVSVELTTAPLHVGPCVVNLGSGADLRALYSFFRYQDSDVGLTDVMPGQRVSLYQ